MSQGEGCAIFALINVHHQPLWKTSHSYFQMQEQLNKARQRWQNKTADG